MRTEIGSGPDTLSASWDSSASHRHRVQFYEDEAFLLEALSRFVGAAILAGGSAIVILTEAHKDGLFAYLDKLGLDLAVAKSEGRFVALDAAETLAKFMVDGVPQFELFASAIGPTIDRLAFAAHGEKSGEKPPVVAFGEMVAQLWAEGKPDAAIHLERFWNQLARTHSFHLYCSYPLNLFSREQDSEGIERICGEHSYVVPTEHYMNATTDQERLRAVLLLQQKAHALEREVLERKKVQQVLHEREAELKDFLENAVIGMHWVAPDGTILWANKAELSMLGYERDEYVGHQISEFHADSHVVEDILQRLDSNEELRGYEARLRCKDGSIKDVRIDSNFFRPSQGKGHTRCFTTDLTEKKQVERELFHLAAIVESSDDAIVGKDLNGIVRSWNLAAERILGYKPEEIIGRPVALLIPPELQNDEVVILAKIRAGERIDHFQTVRLRKNGERIDVSLTISPVKDGRGNIIGAAKILRDVTQQKKLESALHVTERLASVGRLAATVAHEINNPLESVINLLYLAKNTEGLPPSVFANLALADQELARVAHIAQQTLGFYRDTSHPLWVDIAGLVDLVLSVYERKIFYKGITIERRIPPDLKIYARQGELKQILSNLLSNAIDASRQNGKILIRARVSEGPHGPGVRITLADDGSGIPPEIVDRVFSAFFTTKADVGTGIGLWVTRNLLEKSGGFIKCRSSQTPPSGTIMRIFIPASIAEDNALARACVPDLTPGLTSSVLSSPPLG